MAAAEKSLLKKIIEYFIKFRMILIITNTMKTIHINSIYSIY